MRDDPPEDDFPLPDEPAPAPTSPTLRQDGTPQDPDAIPPELALALAALSPIASETLTEFSALQDVMKDDIQFYNRMMTNLALAWGYANPINIEEICKLSETTAKMLKARRQALLLPTEKARGKVFLADEEYDPGPD